MAMHSCEAPPQTSLQCDVVSDANQAATALKGSGYAAAAGQDVSGPARIFRNWAVAFEGNI
jgi:hypothetical protein